MHRAHASTSSPHATETARAVSVPRADYTAWGDITPELRAPGGTMQLRPIQSAALHAIRHAQGGFFPIGVGHGKTLIALLAGPVLGAKFVVVLTKPGVVNQMQLDAVRARRHFRMVDTRVVSYQTLSSPKQSEMLSRWAQVYGDGLVVVADECHELKAETAARTKRVKRMLAEHPGIRFVALSGTMTSKSIRDYAHIAEWALGRQSPVPHPRDTHHLDAWAECLDARGRPSDAEWNVVWPLLQVHGAPVPCPTCTGALSLGRCATCAGTGDSRAALTGAERLDYARRALQARISSCIGVVATTDGSLGVSLVIRTVTPEIPPEIAVPLGIVDELSERPDGEILPDDLSKARCARTLSAGFYQRWVWPDGVVDAAWMKARRAWNACVREQLQKHARDGYDSPLLVYNTVEREYEAGQRDKLHLAWWRWREQHHKRWGGEPTPPSVPTWLSTFYLEALGELLASLSEPAIVWYQSLALEAQLRKFGIPVYGAGTEIPTHRRPELIAASIAAHGTGRNLQAWSVNVIAEPPSAGKTWEQLLGRTHRPGQEADEVTVYVFAHGGFGDAIAAARVGANYIESSTGNRQKLNLATWIED